MVEFVRLFFLVSESLLSLCLTPQEWTPSGHHGNWLNLARAGSGALELLARLVGFCRYCEPVVVHDPSRTTVCRKTSRPHSATVGWGE